MLFEILKLLKRYFAIIFLGPNASGKGTQVKMLVSLIERLGGKVKVIATGAIFVQYVKDNPQGEYFEEVNAALTQGKLVSDATTIALAKPYLDDIKNNPEEYWGYFILFDGFPRTIKQNKMLRKEFGIVISLVIKFTAKLETCIKRTLGRAQKAIDDGGQARVDDTREMAVSRYEIFEEVISDIEELYEGKVITINGEPSPLEVFEQIKKGIMPYLKKMFSEAPEALAKI
jgi:adenylate kinase family enzyme